MGHWDAFVGPAETEEPAAREDAPAAPVVALSRPRQAMPGSHTGAGNAEPVIGRQGADVKPDAAEHAVHETHCHRSLSTCSEQPAPPNLRNFSDLVDLPQPDLIAFLIEEVSTQPTEYLSPPPVEPPRV
jgi:hypothetical protein